MRPPFFPRAPLATAQGASRFISEEETFCEGPGAHP